MDQEASQKIREQLSPGESLLWAGRPRQGIVFRGSDGFMIPFSIVWCAFAVFWMFSAFSSGAPIFFLMFGSIFVIAGLHFVFGRFFVEALQRKHTFYGVSNERVLILSGVFAEKQKSLSLSTLTDLSFSRKSNGRGTISFGPQHPIASMMEGISWPGMEPYKGPQFDMIDDVKSVYDIIQRAQQSRGSR